MERIVAGQLPAAVSVMPEIDTDVPEREALLDGALGTKRKRKASEKLRRGRMPADGLSFSARDGGKYVGTVRLWNVRLVEAFADRKHSSVADVGNPPSKLLLGPLAVDPAWKGQGIGSMLMQCAIAEAQRRGHGAVLLVGDVRYYERFGFSAEKTVHLAMPGPYEKERFLALELQEGVLDGARGVLAASGKRQRRVRAARAA